MEVTKKLLDWVFQTSYEDIPKKMLDLQRRSLIDSCGVMLAASGKGAGCEGFIRYAADKNVSQCRIVGTGLKSDPVTAALANGALSHALDYEDSNSTVTMHPNAVSTPALLAMAELKGGVSGKDFLTALTIADELVCRLQYTFLEDLCKYGWYMGPVAGAFASVIAIAKMLNYSRETTLDAIANCLFMATGSGELVNSKKSVMRAVRDGFGARAAVEACLLAEYQIPTGFETPFEGKMGYFQAYSQGKYDIDRFLDGLGEKWLAENLTFKMWPVCHATQPGIHAMLELMKEENLKFEDITGVHVSISNFSKSIVMEPREVKNRPVNAITAKFSIPYTLGLAAKRGKVTLEDFEPENIPDEDIYRFAEMVTYDVNTNLVDRVDNVNTTDMTIQTTKGTFKRHAVHCPGEIEMPMSDEMFEGKFFSCAGLAKGGYSQVHLTRLYQTLCRVDELEDVREMIEFL